MRSLVFEFAVYAPTTPRNQTQENTTLVQSAPRLCFPVANASIRAHVSRICSQDVLKYAATMRGHSLTFAHIRAYLLAG
eukprot:3699280-Rhodomonas_salina.1